MTTLTIQIPDQDSEVIKKVLEKFKVIIIDEFESPYDQNFVKEIKKGIADKENGVKGVLVDVNNLWS